ncbi:MAG: phage tail protein [Bilophila wadsworthia]
MMYQGVLGTFFFTVTDAEVATFRDLKQQREIQFAEHKCVSGLPKVQHTGRNLDTLSLTVQLFPLTPLALTVDMRIDALRELAVLARGAARARPDLLRPVRAQSVEVQHRIFHNGVTMSAEIALNLTEYN